VKLFAYHCHCSRLKLDGCIPRALQFLGEIVVNQKKMVAIVSLIDLSVLQNNNALVRVLLKKLKNHIS